MSDFEVTRNGELYELTNIGSIYRGDLKRTAQVIVPRYYSMTQIADMKLWRVINNKASRFDVDGITDEDNITNPVYQTQELEDGLYLSNDIISHIIKNLSDEFIMAEESIIPEYSRREISRLTKNKCAELDGWPALCKNLNANNVTGLRDISEKIGLPTKKNGKMLTKAALCAQIGTYMERQFVKKNTIINNNIRNLDINPTDQLRELLTNFDYIEEYLLLSNDDLIKIVEIINNENNTNFHIEKRNSPLVNIFNLYYYLIKNHDNTIILLNNSYEKYINNEFSYLVTSDTEDNEKYINDIIVRGSLANKINVGKYNLTELQKYNIWLLSGDILTDFPLKHHNLYLDTDMYTDIPDGLYDIVDLTKEYSIILTENGGRFLYYNELKWDFHVPIELIKDGIYKITELDIVAVDDKSVVTNINGEIILAKIKSVEVPGIYLYEDVVEA